MDHAADEGREHDQTGEGQPISDTPAAVRLYLRLAVEHGEDQAEGIERGEKGADEPGEEESGVPTGVGFPENLIFAVVAGGDEWKSRERETPHEEAGVLERQLFAQTPHLENVLLVVAGEDHRAGGQEQERLEKGMRHQMK